MHSEEAYLIKQLNTNQVIAAVERALEAKRPITETWQAPEDPLGVIFALAIAIDAKDSRTHGHSVRVARYAAAISEELGLESQEIENILYAGLLHDIGKIGVSEQILHKPAVLNVEEWGVIKAHPVIGAKILEPIPSFQVLIPLVRHHHERYDGTGYPERLIGEAIPLGARILAVADAFEAMTSYRPYSHALCPAQAATLLIEGMGKQWDAKVVKAFLRVLEREMPYQITGSIMRETKAPVRAPYRTQVVIAQ
jgi:putative nucleotidyltransferase with HDIG domain